jgi:hypothetical protein
LQATRKRFSKARQFRDSEYAAFLWNVCDVTFADERREVMFTHRRDADVFHDDHLVMFVTR